MRRKPLATRAAAAAAAAALVTAGCNKDESSKERSPGESSSRPDPGGGTPAAPAPGASPETSPPAAARFAVFPPDADFVASLSLADLRKSPLWDRYRGRLLRRAQGFEQFEEVCGVSPVEAFDSIVAGGVAARQDEIVIRLAGMKRQQMERCSEELAAGAKTELTLIRKGELTRFDTGAGALWAAWLDDHTLLASMNPDPEFLKARARGEEGLDGNRAFMDLLGDVDRSATFWFAALPATGSEMSQGLRQLGGQARALYASVDLGAGLRLDGGLEMDSPAAASRAAALARQALAMLAARSKPLAKYAGEVKIEVQDQDVIVKLALSATELDNLTEALERLAGDPGRRGGAR